MWRKVLRLKISHPLRCFQSSSLSILPPYLIKEKQRCQKFEKLHETKIKELCHEMEMEYHATCEDITSNLHDISGNYEYFYKRNQEQNYSNFYRKKIVPCEVVKTAPVHPPEELLIDMNQLGDIYNELFTVERIKISSNHQYILLLIDLKSSHQKKLLIQSIDHKIICEVSFTNKLDICDGELDIQDDSIAVYVTSTQDGLRPSRLHTFQLTTNQLLGKIKLSKRRMRVIFVPFVQLLLSESDPKYFLMLSRTRDQRYLLIHHLSKSISEISLIDPAIKKSTPQLLVSRSWGKQCFVNHIPGFFLLATRDLLSSHEQSKTRDLMIYRYSSESIVENGNIREITDTTSKSLLWPSSTWTKNSASATLGWIDDYDIYPNRIVAYGKRGPGAIFVQLLDTATGELVQEYNSQNLQELVGYPVTHLTPGANSNYDGKHFRFTVSSPFLPEASFEVDIETGKITQSRMKESPLLKALPMSMESYQASSHDGYLVPLTTFGATNQKLPQPTLLYGYGCYGVALEMDYSPELALLLSRGWQIAFAHTRGGGGLGRFHHEQGRQLLKWNTFLDYRSCAEYLISNLRTTPALLCGSFGSAGGLIGGVLVNEFPRLFKAVVMRNPFLDIYETVQDPSSSALVVHEYEEWGHTDCSDSDSRDILDYIRSYSPCENISSIQDPTVLPAVLLSVGMLDNKVSPEESFKWLKLLSQHIKQHPFTPNKRLILCHILEDSGHEGSSSIIEHFYDQALEITFLEANTNISPSDEPL